ncbi:hypothetical protein H7F51_11995 [Novosphingobium flavum]|uniref:Uncharacterized protein n=1 Tax=Novosphingobium flavum TaxID=1778672 RepID=A0A7X1KME7_9SPHN|nr:hypothetical protein [Novosphingobium flavum]MBC2666240.1 hypothetical protein [Novosphingobium flavum]
MHKVLCAIALAATPALADPQPDKPITRREPNAVDVIATPATDLNLKKDEIPPVLLAAEAAPYALAGLRRCPEIAAEVRRIDAVLGDDFDLGQSTAAKVSAGKVAQSVVGSFIPFRGVIRELSGANAQERRVQLAIYAGSARRAFLKGVGLQRGCPWPARPAPPGVVERIARENSAKAGPSAPDQPAPRR